MDKCFKGRRGHSCSNILIEYMVFSKNEKDHAKHLERMLKICEDNGLVLSPPKMKIAVSTVDFLGAVLGEGTIKLQPHIIKKIVNFNEKDLKTKKGLRSFLGILNYARNHIPKLGILLRPLYEKTNAHGDKRLKPSDYELVRKIKEQVQNLPDLEIPPKNAYIILEIDGCMEGWGGIGLLTFAHHIDSYTSLKPTLFAECTGEVKELAATTLYSVEEVLQSPNAFLKNMKTISEEQQKKQLKPCKTYKQSYNAKLKYALDNQPKITTGQTKEKMFEFKPKKPEESSSNWKPWLKDWDAITSNHLIR
ncbi:hypothetical protein Tco_0581432 [Tanacetum coccineum]